MSSKYLMAVWAAHITPAAKKLVAATLADRADADGGSIYFAVDTVAARSSMSATQARHWLHKLIADGVVVVEKRATQHYPPTYGMSLQALQALASTAAGRSPDESSTAAGRSAEEIQTSGRPTPDLRPADARPPAGRTQYTHRRRKTSGGVADAIASDALSRSARVAPPAADVADEWQRLMEARPELDYAHIAEQAGTLYLGDGHPASALCKALDKLRLTRHHKELDAPPRKARAKSSSGGGRRYRPETFDDVDYDAPYQ